MNCTNSRLIFSLSLGILSSSSFPSKSYGPRWYRPVLQIIDKKGQVDTFILDFEKTFDTPPYELLKSKLFSYGIDGKTLKWINAFLCYTQQRVVVNCVKSDWTLVVSGVPQGTDLGPLLFSLHINDITAETESEIRLFVDDCVCYR